MPVMDSPKPPRTRRSIDGLRDVILADPVARHEYARTLREVEMVDALVRALDARRVEVGMSKAELARRIVRDPSTVRRLFTAGGSNPEIAFLAEIAEALGMRIVLASRE